MKLSNAKEGIYKVVSIDEGKCFNCKCTSMGITIGESIEVINYSKLIPIIVRVRNSNISIGRGFASKIEVEEIKDG